MSLSINRSKTVSLPKKYFSPSNERLKKLGERQEKDETLTKNGQPNKAISSAVRHLADDIADVGLNHEHTASAFHHLGVMCNQNGYPHEGSKFLELSLRILKQNGGVDNPRNSTSYGATATSFVRVGKYQEALDNGLKALKLYQSNHNYDIGDPPSIRKQWELAQVYLALGKQKQKGHDFADARHLYAEGLKHALDAEKGIHICWPHSDIDKKHCKMIIDSIKTQARTLPAPPEWLPSGTIKEMTEPFQDNKLPFTQPEPPLKARL